jgi:hypothetical protein
MRARTLLNIALLLAVLAVGVLLALHVGRRTPPPSPPLTTIVPARVRSFRFRVGRGPLYAFRKIHGRWWQTRPVRVRGNALMIGSLLAGLYEPVARRYPLARVDPAHLGLAPPAITLIVGRTRILFGGTDPVGGYRYIETEGTVDLVHDSLAYRLAGGDTRYLSTRLIGRRGRRRLTAIVLRRFRVERTLHHRWRLVPRRPVSEERLRRFVEHWTYASALGVAPAGRYVVLGRVRLLFRGLPPRRYDIVSDPLGFALVRPRLKLRWEFPEASRKRLFHLPPRRTQRTKPPRARTSGS